MFKMIRQAKRATLRKFPAEEKIRIKASGPEAVRAHEATYGKYVSIWKNQRTECGNS